MSAVAIPVSVANVNTVWVTDCTLWLCLQGPQGPQGVPGEKGPQGEGFPGPKVLFQVYSQRSHQNNSNKILYKVHQQETEDVLQKTF